MQTDIRKSETLAALDSMRLLADSPTLIHVLKFAARMEAKLAKNWHKGDREEWLNDHPWNLVERILDETVEVQQCFEQRGALMTELTDVVLVKTPEETADECADVANFCMMVADSVTAMQSENPKVKPHSEPPAAFKHYDGCPAIAGNPVCTCGTGRVG